MVSVDLLCKALPGGGYRGRIVVDGAPDPDLHVDPGTCEELRALWISARNKYGIAPSVGAECQDCFPIAFLEAESEPPIDRLDRGRGRPASDKTE